MDWAEFVDRLEFIERKVAPLRIVRATSMELSLSRHLALDSAGLNVSPGEADIAYLSDGSHVDLSAV